MIRETFLKRRESSKVNKLRSYLYKKQKLTIYNVMHILHAQTVHSFCEVGPKLLQTYGFQYLLSEVFSQDPFERHKEGSSDNPSVQQLLHNTVLLV